ncbi:MAG: hypothetical protein P4M11_01985 [Candidatus Pacebacteria bacterium]|nr:hypothetical protein [Candidatus Paceibacterota bacterium]
MTANDELAEKFIRKCEAEVGAQIDGGLSEILSGLLDEAYERGRRDENEACQNTIIELVGKWGDPNGSDYEQGAQDMGNKLLGAIRARIKKGEGDE